MTTLQLLIVCVTVLLLAGAVLAAALEGHKASARRTDALLEPPAPPSRFEGLAPGQQIGVQLLDTAGQSVKGVISAVHPEYVELTTAELVAGGSTTNLGTVRLAAGVAQLIQRIRTE